MPFFVRSSVIGQPGHFHCRARGRRYRLAVPPWAPRPAFSRSESCSLLSARARGWSRSVGFAAPSEAKDGFELQ